MYSDCKSRDNIIRKEKGSDTLSKQSNQRYRKEKEREHLKKANVMDGTTNVNNNRQSQDKFNREFDAPSGSVNK